MAINHPKFQPLTMIGQRFLIRPNSNEIAQIHNQQVINKIQVEPKMMEVLMALAGANGKVVNKTQLIDQIWDNYGGADDALTQAISKLRKVFGDTAKRSAVIRTIPKKGYCLLLPVTKIHEDSIPANPPYTTISPVLPPTPAGAFTGFIERLTKPRFFLAFLFFSIVLLAVLGTIYQIVFWMAVG